MVSDTVQRTAAWSLLLTTTKCMATIAYAQPLLHMTENHNQNPLQSNSKAEDVGTCLSFSAASAV